MKIAICDDDQQDMNLLLKYCEAYGQNLTASGFASGSALLAAFDVEFYDLIFMDIEMEHPNGYETAVILRQRDRRPEIIFTTKTLNYAVRGYGIALRYLPKPISYKMFADSLQIALQNIVPEKIMVPYQYGQKIIEANRIIYAEVIKHQVTLHMSDGEKIEFRGTLTGVQDQLQRTWFVQSHKSYCVNLEYIDSIRSTKICLTTGEEIPLGRNWKVTFQSKLREFLKGKH